MVKIVSPPADFKSAVWKHFGFEEITSENDVKTIKKDSTVCRHCDQRLKYNGNTTNMAKHLARRHDITDFEQTKSQRKDNQTITSTNTGSTTNSQLTIQQTLQTKLGRNSVRATAISRSVATFIVTDLRPYSVVENKGFINLIKTLEPKYELPSRPYFSESLIPKMYEEVKEHVLGQLSKAQFAAITTDGWTSRATVSYITVTVHYISDEWKLKNHILQTRPMYESHTGANIGEMLKAAITDWGLDRLQGMVPVVTDNASNMDGAVRQAGLGPSVKCFAHTVNLATQRGLSVPTVKTLLARIRRVVAFFHRSSVANSVLKQKQTLLKLPNHKLIMDVPTRWNSSHDMIDRYLEQQPAVLATLLCPEIRKNAKDLITLSVFSHTVNLATQRGLSVPTVKTLLARIRRVVAFFHRL